MLTVPPEGSSDPANAWQTDQIQSLAYLCFIHILFFRQLLRDMVWHPSNGRHLHCGMLLMHFLVLPSLIQLAPELLQCPRP